MTEPRVAQAWVEHLIDPDRDTGDNPFRMIESIPNYTVQAPALSQGQNSIDGEIALLARFLWEENGRPVNKDVEFWLRSEQMLRSFSRSQVTIRPGNPAL